MKEKKHDGEIFLISGLLSQNDHQMLMKADDVSSAVVHWPSISWRIAQTSLTEANAIEAK